MCGGPSPDRPPPPPHSRPCTSRHLPGSSRAAPSCWRLILVPPPPPTARIRCPLAFSTIRNQTTSPPHPPWPPPPYRHTRSVCRGQGGAVWWGDGPPVHLVSLTCDAQPVGMTPGSGVRSAERRPRRHSLSLQGRLCLHGARRPPSSARQPPVRVTSRRRRGWK